MTTDDFELPPPIYPEPITNEEKQWRHSISLHLQDKDNQIINLQDEIKFNSYGIIFCLSIHLISFLFYFTDVYKS